MRAFASSPRRIAIAVALALLCVSQLPAVQVQSGMDGRITATVDSTPQALRVITYDSRGSSIGQKATYSASLTAKTATAAGTAPWFSLCGSASKTVRVQRFMVAGTVGTAAVYADLVLIKTSAATSAGTPVALTKVPNDSASAASTANAANFYSALATAGAPVGAVASATIYMPITGTVTATMPPLVLDFTSPREAEGIVLRGVAQCLEASFGTTTTNAPTLTTAVVWTEE
jgi:hypothetical protein